MRGREQPHFLPWLRQFILLVALISWAACDQYKQHASTQPAAALTKVVLAQNPVPHSALPIIAKKKGFFQEEGLDVSVKEFTTGKLCFDAMLAGGAEFSTVADTPIVYAGFSKQPIFVIATIMSSPTTVKVLARKDKGVSRPEDLRGKPIGTFKGGNAEYFLAQFLKKSGMTIKDVRVTYMQPPELVTAIIRGDLVAISMWEPHIYTAQKAIGEAAVVFTEPDLYTETFNIAVMQAYAKKNNKTVESFLQALAKAATFLTSNPAEAKQILLDSISIDEDTLDHIWPEFHFELALGQKLAELLEKEADFAIETGSVATGSEVPSYEAMIEPRFLRLIELQPMRAK